MREILIAQAAELEKTASRQLPIDHPVMRPSSVKPDWHDSHDNDRRRGNPWED